MPGLVANCVGAKIVVADIERSSEFYRAVCGLEECRRVETAIDGRPLKQVILQSEQEGPALFALLQYLDDKRPPGGQAIFVFRTADLEVFLARVAQFGGQVVERMKPRPCLHVGIWRDIDGNLHEVVEGGF